VNKPSEFSSCYVTLPFTDQPPLRLRPEVSSGSSITSSQQPSEKGDMLEGDILSRLSTKCVIQAFVTCFALSSSLLCVSCSSQVIGDKGLARFLLHHQGQHVIFVSIQVCFIFHYVFCCSFEWNFSVLKRWDFQKDKTSFKKKIPITHNLRVLQIKAKDYKGKQRHHHKTLIEALILHAGFYLKGWGPYITLCWRKCSITDRPMLGNSAGWSTACRVIS
jgi:hypothetical protein